MIKAARWRAADGWSYSTEFLPVNPLRRSVPRVNTSQPQWRQIGGRPTKKSLRRPRLPPTGPRRHDEKAKTRPRLAPADRQEAVPSAEYRNRRPERHRPCRCAKSHRHCAPTETVRAGTGARWCWFSARPGTPGQVADVVQLWRPPPK